MREDQPEVLVVGAGPVGLLTALLLAEAGVKVIIIDSQEHTATRSYGCALHPRTLELLDRHGLIPALLKSSRRLETMAFYEGDTRQAEVNFTQSSANFPFLLTLPQSAFEKILENRLAQAGVRVNWNHRFDSVREEEDYVVATVQELAGTATGYIVPHWETIVKKQLQLRTQFLIGADGANSVVRQRLGIEYERAGKPDFFAACEFKSDDADLGEVRVVLDEATTNVLWPLPENMWRWTFQLIGSALGREFPEKERRTARLAHTVLDDRIRDYVQKVAHQRAPWFSAKVMEIAWCTEAGFEYRRAKEFGRNRCWLVGDSAHQTGPVGVQSMNSGLGEAHLLAGLIEKILHRRAPLAELRCYNQSCQEQWLQLLGVTSALYPGKLTNPWLRSRCARILACLPSSASDLPRFAQELTLEFRAATAERVQWAMGNGLKFAFALSQLFGIIKLLVLRMKTTTRSMLLSLTSLALGAGILYAEPTPPAAPVSVPVSTNSGPKIQFATPQYDFGKVSAGELVKHTFIFTNIGNQTLELSNVQPSCGCTTAGEWTKKVEPGQTGIIPIQFNSQNFNGQVLKTVTVTSNDKSQPQVTLQLKGTIWRAIEVNPQFALLNIQPESPSNAPAHVRIVNNLETPLLLSPPECTNRSFSLELKTNQPGKEYELVVSAASGLSAGNVQGQITMKTSSTNMPVITVSAWANVQPVIAINPPRVTLPPGPLANKMSPTVMITYNGTNQLNLSDAMVNVEGVDVQLKELTPGRSYSATLNFPQGFEIAQGKQVEFTVKSTHPKYPELKVPIAQIPRPATQATVPVTKPLPSTPQSGATPSAVVPQAKPASSVPSLAPAPPLPPGQASRQ